MSFLLRPLTLFHVLEIMTHRAATNTADVHKATYLGRDPSSVASPVGVLDVSYPKQVPQYVHFIPRSLAHAFKGALVDGAQTFRLSVKLTSGSE